MSDARNFLMSSDHQVDKIIFFKEQRITPDRSQGWSDINVDLPFSPLIFGVWSITPDFMVCHPFTQGGILSMRTGMVVVDSVSISISSSGGRPNILLSNFFTSLHDYYVRIYGFMPTDAELSADITSNSAQEFILSSDYNYRKLALAGVLPYTVSMTGMFAQASSVVINHNLGYLPQVMAWLETSYANNKEIIPFGFSQGGSNVAPYGNVTLTSSSVIITPVPGQWGDDFKVHYRIYYDEA